MPSTGATATQSGSYQSDCHSNTVSVFDGATFPTCPHCHRSTYWIFSGPPTEAEKAPKARRGTAPKTA